MWFCTARRLRIVTGVVRPDLAHLGADRGEVGRFLRKRDRKQPLALGAGGEPTVEGEGIHQGADPTRRYAGPSASVGCLTRANVAADHLEHGPEDLAPDRRRVHERRAVLVVDEDERLPSRTPTWA